MESFRLADYRQAGIVDEFVQDNISRSAAGILRGLHYQISRPLARVVTVMDGTVFDVAVDLRLGSPTFGKWDGVVLGGDGPSQAYLPAGFAHGFIVIGDGADLHYKMSGYYNPVDEGGIVWNDPDIGIDWPSLPTGISPRDAAFRRLRDIAASELPLASIEI